MGAARQPALAAGRCIGRAAGCSAGAAAGHRLCHAGWLAARIRAVHRRGALHHRRTVWLQLACHERADQRQFPGAVCHAVTAGRRLQPRLHPASAGRYRHGWRHAVADWRAAPGRAGQFHLARRAVWFHLWCGAADCRARAARPAGPGRGGPAQRCGRDAPRGRPARHGATCGLADRRRDGGCRAAGARPAPPLSPAALHAHRAGGGHSRVVGLGAFHQSARAAHHRLHGHALAALSMAKRWLVASCRAAGAGVCVDHRSAGAGHFNCQNRGPALRPAYRREPRISRPGPVQHRRRVFLVLRVVWLHEPLHAQPGSGCPNAAGVGVFGRVVAGAGGG